MSEETQSEKFLRELKHHINELLIPEWGIGFTTKFNEVFDAHLLMFTKGDLYFGDYIANEMMKMAKFPPQYVAHDEIGRVIKAFKLEEEAKNAQNQQ